MRTLEVLGALAGAAVAVPALDADVDVGSEVVGSAWVEPGLSGVLVMIMSGVFVIEADPGVPVTTKALAVDVGDGTN